MTCTLSVPLLCGKHKHKRCRVCRRGCPSPTESECQSPKMRSMPQPLYAKTPLPTKCTAIARNGHNTSPRVPYACAGPRQCTRVHDNTSLGLGMGLGRNTDGSLMGAEVREALRWSWHSATSPPPAINEPVRCATQCPQRRPWQLHASPIRAVQAAGQEVHTGDKRHKGQKQSKPTPKSPDHTQDVGM